MTTWTHQVIIVPAAYVEAARELGAALDPAGQNMYTTPLSETGTVPATHYVSSGLIDENMVPLLSNAEWLYGAALQGAKTQGIELKTTLKQAEALVAQSIVSNADPFFVLEENNLQMIHDDPVHE